MLNRCLSSLRAPLVAPTVLLACVLAGPALAQPVQADFNGDQYSDVAIGAPRDYTGGSSGGRSDIRVGTVTVMYGSSSGLANPGGKCSLQGGVPPAAPCAQLWDQGVPGLAGQGYLPGNEFGESLAAGDFNRDGFADLAVGDPYPGRVQVLYGSMNGLHLTGNQEWSLNSPGMLGDPSGAWDFGKALAVGDFNSDGFADLSIGAPYEPHGLPNSSGAVHLLYGSASGLSTNGNELWTKPKAYFNAAGLFFGDALAAGDFNGDGASDLAVHDKNAVNNTSTPGAVHFLYGSVVGLTLSNPRFFDSGSPAIDDGGIAVARFGVYLAKGNFNGDSYSDLAIGSESYGPGMGGGRVNVLYGSAYGLDSGLSQVLHQDLPGIRGVQEVGGQFGSALAAGDFDGTGFDDLAAADPVEAINGLAVAGAVNIILGSPYGLTALDNALWHQDSLGVLDEAEELDNFGTTLAAGDFDGDGRVDLIVGVPFEAIAGTTTWEGAVTVLRGTSGEPRGDAPGLTASGNQFWHQDSPGIPGVLDEDDRFGSVVASGLPSRP